MKNDPECCCNREVCTYDPDTGCGSRRMFGDGLGRRGTGAVAQGPTELDQALSLMRRLDQASFTDGTMFEVIQAISKWLAKNDRSALPSTNRAINLPGHDETMANLDALTIRSTEGK